MPYSSPLFDDVVERVIQFVSPHRALDIGTGNGKYGRLIRSLCPDAHITGVEIEPSYIERFSLADIYDELRVQHAIELLKRPDETFDMVIFGDVIEHLRKSEGLDLLNFFAYRTKYMLVRYPEQYIQNTWEGIPSEAHVSFWTFSDFLGLDHLTLRREQTKVLVIINAYLCVAPITYALLGEISRPSFSQSIPQVQEPISQARQTSTSNGDAELPLVSIVIPCFNKANYLGQAIESALTQSYPRLEIIVVDDGSTDLSLSIANAYAQDYPELVQVISQSNLGVSKARDAGINASKGEYVLPLDADDFLHPKAVEILCEYARANPHFAVIYSNCYRVNERGLPDSVADVRELSVKQEGNILSSMLGGGIVTCTSLIKKENLLEVGGYHLERVSNDSQGHEDYFLYMRMLLFGKSFGYVPQPLFYYRDTPNSLSKDQDRKFRGIHSAWMYGLIHFPKQMTDALAELTQTALQKQAETVALKEHMQAEMRRIIAESEQQVAALTAAHTAALAELTSRQQAEQAVLAAEHAAELERQSSQHQAERAALSAKLSEAYSELDAERRRIAAMQNTRGWRMLESWWRFKIRALPPGSIRLRVYQLTSAAMAILFREGPFALVKRLFLWLRGERRYHARPDSHKDV